MDVSNSVQPKLSVWSPPASVIAQNDETSDERAEQFNSLHQPVKCSTWLSPCVQGLLLGVMTNGLTLAIVLTVWLTPRRGIGAILTNELPPGTILLYDGNLSSLAGSTHRWLLCDGSEVSRLIYRDLFHVIGIMHGSGNGNDTFNLPDFRTRFPLGSNSSQLVTGGASSHVLIQAEMPTHHHDPGTLSILPSGQHTHNYSDPGHNHGGNTGTTSISDGSSGSSSSNNGGGSSGAHSHSIPSGMIGIKIQPTENHTHSLQGSTSSVGENRPIDMMPPYQTIHYIIRA